MSGTRCIYTYTGINRHIAAMMLRLPLVRKDRRFFYGMSLRTIDCGETLYEEIFTRSQ